MVKKVNGVIEPWVDVASDIAAINRGEAVRQGSIYLINGRQYGLETSGRAYPIAGPGIHRLSRGAFKALGVYNTFGQTARAEAILDAMPISEEERVPARVVRQAGQRRSG
ncbi:MAG: hypothetical protein HY690_09565 [Chloroflexi bacterium]|nr:hypothetical protein [Chloroflexota bacterium]